MATMAIAAHIFRRFMAIGREHEMLSTAACLTAAKEALQRDGQSVSAAEVHQLAKARGISYGTLRRAFGELGVESLPQPQGIPSSGDSPDRPRPTDRRPPKSCSTRTLAELDTQTR